MPPDTPNPADAKARTGSGNAVCFGGEHFPDSGPKPKKQANIGVPHLRLVTAVTAARPRRIVDVRIAASDAGFSIGRSRAFRLDECDLDRLIATATALKAAP